MPEDGPVPTKAEMPRSGNSEIYQKMGTERRDAFLRSAYEREILRRIGRRKQSARMAQPTTTERVDTHHALPSLAGSSGAAFATYSSMTLRPESSSEPIPTTRRIVRFELAPQTMIIVGLIIIGVGLLVRLVPVLLVTVAALMIVGALNPLVAALERRKVPRLGAIGLVFGTAVALIALGASITAPALLAQLRALAAHEPEIRGRVVEYLTRSPLTQNLANELRDVQYGALLKDSKDTLLSASVRAVEIAAYAGAAIFLALYIMIDRDRLRAGLFTIVPRAHHVRFSRVLVNLETIVGGYIRGQVITCVLIGFFIFGLLMVCHVPDALALAVLGAVLDVLPYIGALLTIAPVVIASYAVGPGIALTVLVLLGLYEEFESRVLVPLIYGRALRLPASVVFLSLLAGGVLDGIVGALLALPVASAVLMLIHELRVELPGETEQPEDVVVRKKDQREEREYEQRTEAAPVTEASAIAVEIARERKAEEKKTEERTDGEAEQDKR
jgi:putative heme transporter